MNVTIIMPLHNHAAYVGAALLSLLAQKDDCSLDILVVDDGSTDESPAIVSALARSHPEIRVVTTPNQGVTKTRNVGLRHLRDDCEFVSFCDSDDICPRGRLRADLAAFGADPAIQFTLAKILAVDRIDPETMLPGPGARTAQMRVASLSAAIFRKTFMDRIGSFDEAMVQAEDTDYLMRAFESGAPSRLTDTIAVYYRRHDANMTLDTQLARRYVMQALHRALHRRRQGSTAPLPQGVFGFDSP